ncbi:hypothetical protein ACFZBM_32950 [Streptomyces lavendulae]|uniref:hypothetical protein n=1 Tax=Streptomyces lavendulae TaxID=1914 RepID=UPI0036EF9DC8
MRLTLWRMVLSPLTSRRARRLQREAGNGLSFDAAWRQARMLSAPDEMVYRLRSHQFPVDGGGSEGEGENDGDSTPSDWNAYRRLP